MTAELAFDARWQCRAGPAKLRSVSRIGGIDPQAVRREPSRGRRAAARKADDGDLTVPPPVWDHRILSVDSAKSAQRMPMM